MMSIIKSAMHRQDARITLVYANRDEKSIIFREQLLDLALAHPGQLVVHHWLQSVAGIPTSSDVSEALAAHRDADVFVCGPKPYMDLVTTTALNFSAGRRREFTLRNFVLLTVTRLRCGRRPAQPPPDHPELPRA